MTDQLKSTDLTRSEWDVLDGIIEEARLTRGTRYTQSEAVDILVDERLERGILSANEAKRLHNYLGEPTPKVTPKVTEVTTEVTGSLPADAALALANAHLLATCPGRITRIRVSDIEIGVDSLLDSPFKDHTPSHWVTIFSRVDGHTVTCDVVETSHRIETAS